MSEIKNDNTKYNCVGGSCIKNGSQKKEKHLTSKKHMDYIQI